MKGPSKKVLAWRLKHARRHPNSKMTADEIITEALKHKVYVAYSGGRCSQVALYLTLQQDPDIPVVFNNTGIEYPETVTHVRKTAEEWNLNYHELKPEANYWDLVKEHGFPQLRGSSKKKRPRKPACCTYLKEAPAKKFVKEYNMDGLITGIRVEENRPRALAYKQVGPFYKAVRDKLWKFHPIALWSMTQLMKFVKEENIEINPLYDREGGGLPRIGCMPCTGFTTWRQQLKMMNPKYFKWLNREVQKSIGEPTLWEYVDRFDICDEVDIGG